MKIERSGATLLTLLLGLVLAQNAAAQDGRKGSWTHERPEALAARIASARRPVVVLFSAKWSAPCQALEESLDAEDVRRELEEYLCLRVDCTERAALADARSISQIKGVPSLRFYNFRGDFVYEFAGTVDADSLARRLRASVTATSNPVKEIAARSATGMDTHRAVLRNRGVIEGRLAEYTTDCVVMECEGETTILLKTRDVLRVELLTIRHRGAALETVQPVSTAAPAADAPALAPQAADAPAPAGAALPQAPPEVLNRIEQELAKSETWSNPLSARLAATVKDLGAPAVRYLLQRVPSLKGEARRNALEALEASQSSEANAELREALRDQDMAVRLAAARVLGRNRDRESAEPMVALLGDPESRVRAEAARALDRLGHVPALAPMAAFVSDPSAEAATEGVRAAVHLARQSGKEVLLVRLWLRMFAGGATPVRLEILKGLSAMSDAPLEESLRNSIASDLARGLRDRDALVRAASAITFGDLRLASGVQNLIDRLTAERESDPAVAVCDALGRLRRVETVLPLIQALKSDSAEVRAAAARALRDITKITRFGSRYESWRAWYDENKGVLRVGE